MVLREENPKPRHRPARLLAWPTERSQTSPPAPTQTPIPNYDALRRALANTTSITSSSPPSSPPQPQQHNLLTLHGFSNPLVNALKDDGKIDPAFTEALATGTAYRPARSLRERAAARRMQQQQQQQQQQRGGSKSGQGRSWWVWGVPGFVDADEGARAAEERGMVAVTRLPGRRGEKTTETGVVFCRVGLWRWVEGSLDVLLWDEVFVARTEDDGGDGGGDGDGDSAGTTGSKGPAKGRPALEDVLVDALGYGWEAKDVLADVLSEVIYERWLDLFDLVEHHRRTLSEESLTCYWQMLRALEHNEESAPDSHWPKLMSRIRHRIALLSVPRSKLAITPPATSRTTTVKTLATPKVKSISRSGTTASGFPPQGDGDKDTASDENQRALDRISYIGGILIPLPIVSGIPSMGELYGPGGSRFYVFWAVSIPVTILTVVLIYADTIRKSEVWVEIKPDSVEPTPEPSPKEDTEPVRAEVEDRRTATWTKKRRPNGHGGRPDEREPSPSAQPEEDMIFEVDYDVEERMVGMAVPESQTVGAQPPDGMANGMWDVDMLPGPAYSPWQPGLVSLPVVILERPADGSKPKAWKRKRLGWYGAIRAIVYKWPRVGSDVPTGVAASEKKRTRRKALSY
ncbi:hypothetical protein VTK26DRAFT_2322 [Humicola hyalothermophila]